MDAGSGRILVLLPGAHLRPLALGKTLSPRLLRARHLPDFRHKGHGPCGGSATFGFLARLIRGESIYSRAILQVCGLRHDKGNRRVNGGVPVCSRVEESSGMEGITPRILPTLP